MKNIVVFASGSGSNFQSILDAIKSGSITARVTGLITNRTGIKASERAEKAGIPVHILIPTNFSSPTEYVHHLLYTLDALNTDLIVLAGYLNKIPSEVIEKYDQRILNIHPSLLPDYGGKGYYGLHVHKAVIENGESKSGCSVHVVTEEYDEGPVIAQTEVTVNPDETPESLAAKVLRAEHTLYPFAIQNYIKQLN